MNTVKDQRERVGRMLLMHASSREDVKEARAGDIVAIAGLNNTTTGDTLCDPLKPVILERMEYPEHVIEIAFEPKTKTATVKMRVVLRRLDAEYPSSRLSRETESGHPLDMGLVGPHLGDIKAHMNRVRS